MLLFLIIQAVTEIHGEKHLEVLEKLDDARREQRELLASKVDYSFISIY